MADFNTEIDGRAIGFDDEAVAAYTEAEFVAMGKGQQIAAGSGNQEEFLKYVYKTCTERTGKAPAPAKPQVKTTTKASVNPENEPGGE